MSAKTSIRPTKPTRAAACFVEHAHGTPIAGTPPPRPCPFCGSLEVSIAGQDDDFGYFVECTGCHCEGPLRESALDAAEWWNKAELRNAVTLDDRTHSRMLSDLSRVSATAGVLRDQLLDHCPETSYGAVAALIEERLEAFTHELDRMSIDAAQGTA